MNDGTKRALISAAAAGAAWLALYRATRDGKPLGFMDNYRVSADYPPELSKFPGTPANPIRKKGPDPETGGYQKIDNMLGKRKVNGKTWTSFGSPLLSSTMKLRAPSWSLRSGSSCPVITFSLADAMEDLGKSHPRDMTDSEIVDKLIKKIPDKCWSCYAKSNTYTHLETQRAQTRRLTWFDETDENKVVDTLVDAIKVAGREKCDTQTKKCVFDGNATPEYFRLFDSGDFHNERAVRIWHKVAKRLPEVNFWAPTTAWAAHCNDTGRADERNKIVSELEKMAELPNVTVRFSATQINQAAPTFKAAGREFAGSAVGEIEHGKKKGVITWAQKSADGKVEIPEGVRRHPGHEKNAPMYVNIEGKRHYVCPGDCTTCRHCWKRPKKGKENLPVVYLRHGAKPSKGGLIEIVRRVAQQSDTEKTNFKEVRKALERDIAPRLINNARNGPGNR